PFRCRENLGLEVFGDANDTPRFELAAGMHHRLPHRFAERSQQEHLGGRSVVADAEEPSAENARGVEHECVAGGNELLEIAELSVRDLARRAVHHHELAVPASRGWRLRDAVDWDVEVVVGGAGAVFGHERLSRNTQRGGWQSS